MPEPTQAIAPPHNLEAEQAVLGAIIVDPACMVEVSLILKRPEMFWRVSHQHAYRAMQQLWSEGQEIDWVSVTEQVRRVGALEACGGAESFQNYLTEVAHGVPSAYGAERYATIVRDRHLMREIALRSGDARAMALDETRTPADVLAKLEADVHELASQRYHGETHSMQALIQQVMDQQARMREWRQSHDGHALPALDLSAPHRVDRDGDRLDEARLRDGERVGKRNERRLGDAHRVGHAAVAEEAHELQAADTTLRRSRCALGAAAAEERRLDRVRDAPHTPRELVTEHEGKRAEVREVKVGAADRRGGHLEQDARSGRPIALLDCNAVRGRSHHARHAAPPPGGASGTRPSSRSQRAVISIPSSSAIRGR